MSQSSLNVTPLATGATTKTPSQSKSELIFTFTPSADKVNLNLLILLHGLGMSHKCGDLYIYCLYSLVSTGKTGDTEEPYKKLGINLKLPQTATMAVQAPEPVPYMDDGYQWFPSFDLLTGESKWLLMKHHVLRIYF